MSKKLVPFKWDYEVLQNLDDCFSGGVGFIDSGIRLFTYGFKYINDPTKTNHEFTIRKAWHQVMGLEMNKTGLDTVSLENYNTEKNQVCAVYRWKYHTPEIIERKLCMLAYIERCGFDGKLPPRYGFKTIVQFMLKKIFKQKDISLDIAVCSEFTNGGVFTGFGIPIEIKRRFGLEQSFNWDNNAPIQWATFPPSPKERFDYVKNSPDYIKVDFKLED